MQSGAAADGACRTWQSLVLLPFLMCRCWVYVTRTVPAWQRHGTLMMKIFWCLLSHTVDTVQSTSCVSDMFLGP